MHDTHIGCRPYTALNAPKIKIFEQKLGILLFLASKKARLSTKWTQNVVKFSMIYLDCKLITPQVSAPQHAYKAEPRLFFLTRLTKDSCCKTQSHTILMSVLDGNLLSSGQKKGAFKLCTHAEVLKLGG